MFAMMEAVVRCKGLVPEEVSKRCVYVVVVPVPLCIGSCACVHVGSACVCMYVRP
jgi:hypothetical protein